jgi:uncharacterized membrane protein
MVWLIKACPEQKFFGVRNEVRWRRDVLVEEADGTSVGRKLFKINGVSLVKLKLRHCSRLVLLATLLLSFGLAVSPLDQAELWHDEVWSLWVTRGSWGETLSRVAADVHPPLYFLGLQLWVRLVGESVFGLRLPSVFFGLLGVSATYRLGRNLFDRPTGLAAALLLGTHSFLIYYMGEARMYTLLLALAVLATWAYVWWLESWKSGRVEGRRIGRLEERKGGGLVLNGAKGLKDGRIAGLKSWKVNGVRSGVYGLAMAALPLTHYYGALIPLGHGLHLALSRPQRLPAWLVPVGMGLLLYLPWLGALLNQLQNHPGGPLALPQATSRDTITWLLTVLSGGAGWWLLSPFVLGKALPRLKYAWRPAVLLIIWLLLTPLVVLALNTWFAPLYQLRYLIAVLPALTLLVGYALRCVGWQPLGLVLLAAFTYTNIDSYDHLWPPRSPWRADVVRAVVAARQPGDISLVKIVRPYSMEAYYDRKLGLRNASTIDLSPRLYRPAEMAQLIEQLPTTASIWVMMPNNVGETWQAMAQLDRGRQIGYRDSTGYMLFYRFDRGQRGSLRFYFGDKLRYAGAPFSFRSVQPGESICVKVELLALVDLNGSYSYGLHLVDRGNAMVAQHDEGLGLGSAGDSRHLAPCLPLPLELAAGDYYLHLAVYTWLDGRRLPVVEGDVAPVNWGDALVIGALTVTD